MGAAWPPGQPLLQLPQGYLRLEGIAHPLQEGGDAGLLKVLPQLCRAVDVQQRPPPVPPQHANPDPFVPQGQAAAPQLCLEHRFRGIGKAEQTGGFQPGQSGSAVGDEALLQHDVSSCFMIWGGISTSFRKCVGFMPPG